MLPPAPRQSGNTRCVRRSARSGGGLARLSISRAKQLLSSSAKVGRSLFYGVEARVLWSKERSTRSCRQCQEPACRVTVEVGLHCQALVYQRYRPPRVLTVKAVFCASVAQVSGLAGILVYIKDQSGVCRAPSAASFCSLFSAIRSHIHGIDAA